MLAKAAFSTIIPSIHDNLPLECVIYHEEKYLVRRKDPSAITGAIFAHPYAPLGGCKDDPVVTLIANELLQKGFIVALFNFRGAGKSGGRTSWSSKPEQDDYASVACFVIMYATLLLQYTQENDTNIGKKDDNADRLKMIFGGYSYGSLIASRTKPADVLFRSFMCPQNSKEFLAQLAGKIEHLTALQHSLFSCKQPKLQICRMPRIITSYLLVSPLLPPLTYLLTLSMPRLWLKSTEEQLSEHSTLALFGANDTITSSQRLTAWGRRLSSIPGSKFRFCKIATADHFWNEHGGAEELRYALSSWVDDLDFDMVEQS